MSFQQCVILQGLEVHSLLILKMRERETDRQTTGRETDRQTEREIEKKCQRVETHLFQRQHYVERSPQRIALSQVWSELALWICCPRGGAEWEVCDGWTSGVRLLAVVRTSEPCHTASCRYPTAVELVTHTHMFIYAHDTH